MDRLAIAFGDDLTTAIGRTWAAFLFACETAMRAGEICQLEPADIRGKVAVLPVDPEAGRRTKTMQARRVPLSPAAIAILDRLPKGAATVFDLRPTIRDALWRKGCKRAAVDGLRFHDSRAYATTMLSKKVDAVTLARITGHRDLNMILRVYYRESAEDIADRL